MNGLEYVIYQEGSLSYFKGVELGEIVMTRDEEKARVYTSMKKAMNVENAISGTEIKLKTD